MQINELINNSYETAKSKGWWDDKNRNIPELLALIHSEVSEALEAYLENGYEVKVGNHIGDIGYVIQFQDFPQSGTSSIIKITLNFRICTLKRTLHAVWLT